MLNFEKVHVRVQNITCVQLSKMEQVKRDAVIKNATEITLHMIKELNQMTFPNEKLRGVFKLML